MRFELDLRLERPSGFRLEAAFSCETDRLAIVGPSGSGKSTLLEALAGIEPGGRVVLDGKDRTDVPLHARRVGFVPQDSLLFPHLSVRENLGFSPSAEGIERAAESLGIGHLLDRMPRGLSGGERRRAALARAIASRPELLLLDEPFSGLDEPRRREAMSLLDEAVRSCGLPMVLVSHLSGEVIGLTDFAVRLEDGKVAAEGPTPSVLRVGEGGVDNYFTGEVIGKDRVKAGSVELEVPLPEGASGRSRLACCAHDILLASRKPEGLSARNIFPVEVTRLSDSGGELLALLDQPPLRVLLTPAAVKDLNIHPGAALFAILKATSISYLGPA